MAELTDWAPHPSRLGEALIVHLVGCRFAGAGGPAGLVDGGDRDHFLSSGELCVSEHGGLGGELLLDSSSRTMNTRRPSRLGRIGCQSSMGTPLWPWASRWHQRTPGQKQLARRLVKDGKVSRRRRPKQHQHEQWDQRHAR
ncbi:MAG: hypothetical protein M3069_03375 [Chloroflexota bacterium]|nr:hypothetical protein [Chloroflexota bacterium]